MKDDAFYLWLTAIGCLAYLAMIALFILPGGTA